MGGGGRWGWGGGINEAMAIWSKVHKPNYTQVCGRKNCEVEDCQLVEKFGSKFSFLTSERRF